MKKIVLIPLIVLGVLAAIVIYFYITYFMTGAFATLIVDSGTVQYKSSESWTNAQSGMALKQGYSLKTLSGSSASIILANSVMRMDENTEISLDSMDSGKVSISQIIGKTWTKLFKISGISSYEISTPDAIATVRGTAFGVESGNETRIAVAEGNVSAEAKGTGASSIIGANKEATINENDANITEEDINLDEWINGNMGLDAKYRDALKQKLISRYGNLFSLAQQQGANQTDIDTFVYDWIDGKRSINKMIENGEISGSIALIIPPELKRY